jgi:NADH:ubiquinone oxidoreductase subunit E
MEGQFFSLFWRNFVDKKITKQYTRNKIVKELTIEQELEFMKKVEVKVCVCTACVMNGSVEIMESVESLRHLREQMEDGDMIQGKRELIVATDKCLGGVSHEADSPMVEVNGKVFTKADSESVMSYIIDCFKEEK